ncbi:MAG: glycosyltransferase [Anaerolineae bacterium]|nr:glycosyltransferase [Anaerolineae bacterium]
MSSQLDRPTPKVSVIIPVYNQAEYLGPAIESVLTQSFPAHEIVVINDGSTDHSSEVAAKYHDRIRYISQANQGLAGARNTGIEASHGDWIAFLDSDDAWLPDYLESMVAFAGQNPQAVVFYCAAQCMDRDGNGLPQVVGYRSVESAGMYEVLLRTNFIIPSTVLARRESLQAAGSFDRNLRSCEDWDLWLNILERGGQIMGYPTVLVQYRIHGTSLSANVATMQHSHHAVIQKHFGPDDQQYERWNDLKRFAYGGLYRYQLLTNIQRKQDWQGSAILEKAFLADPSNCSDIDFFYDLALGSQPVGYRGSRLKLNLEDNVRNLQQLLDGLFSEVIHPHNPLQPRRRVILGTAYKAVGMLAYNTDRYAMCRKYLRHALWQQPALLFNEKWICGYFVKSLFGKFGLGWVRQARKEMAANVK